MTSIIICYVTCWACKMGECPEKPHVWWDMDDYDFTPERCKELPEGKCNCYCMKDYKGEIIHEADTGEVPALQ